MPVPERGCFTAHWSMDIGAIAVVSGPDAGRIINLGATSDATIGRAAELRIDDPGCEVVHARFDRAGGTITPLGGRVASAVGGDYRIGGPADRRIGSRPEVDDAAGVGSGDHRDRSDIHGPVGGETPPLRHGHECAGSHSVRRIATGKRPGRLAVRLPVRRLPEVGRHEPTLIRPRPSPTPQRRR